MRGAAAALAIALAACGVPEAGAGDAGARDAEADGGDETPATLTFGLGAIPDEGALVLDEILTTRSGGARIDLVEIPDAASLSVEVRSAAPVEAEAFALPPTERGARSLWWRSHPASEPTATIAIDAEPGVEVRVRIVARRPAVDADPERSLVWTDPAIVDDPRAVGLGRVMGAAADGHGGALLDDWLRTFARTAHSERPALADLADHLRGIHGEDPSRWEMDALPFRVTAVHNRIDLRNDAHCGELRVSLNVTDPAFPFIHFLFLFAQEPTPLDVSLTGRVHCEDTAARWAALSGRDDERFAVEARAILDHALAPSSFLMAESLERSVGTWEWRQWTPAAGGLDNPPLFQTVDVARLDAPGSEREAFLWWVASEGDAILARRAEIPPRFAPRSARATEGVVREALRLDGLEDLDPTLDPDAVAEALDVVGCPGCHARSPTFLQTNADRSFSPFYARELEARAEALDSFRTGAPIDAPFGALSD